MRTKTTFNDLCVKVVEHLGYEDEVYDGVIDRDGDEGNAGPEGGVRKIMPSLG